MAQNKSSARSRQRPGTEKKEKSRAQAAKNLNAALLDSLPYPAMYIRRKDRVVLAANAIALKMGVQVGGQCWRGFTKEEYLSPRDKQIAEREDLVPGKLGVKCVFCLGDECILGAPKQSDPQAHIFDSIWELNWIKAADDIYLHYAVNVVESAETDKSLRIALAKYKTLFECFPLGIVIADKAGNILEANPAAAKLLAVPREEYTRRSVDELEWKIVRPNGTLMPPDEFASVRALKEKRLVENAEMGVQRPDGSLVWLSVTAAPLPVENYGVVVAYNDITTRKQMEEALKGSEKKYRLLYESMIDGFVRVDMEGHILEYNLAYKQMLGYSDAKLNALTYMDITPEKWREFEAGIVENQILPRGYSDIYEKEYRRKDGSVFPVELRTVLLRGKQGKPSEMWAIVRDMTARKQAREALEISNAELKAALEREKQLAHTDMLTGVNNRRSLYEIAARDIEIAARYRQPFSMILFDLDHFKKVNDVFGHTVGDKILAKAAETARAELRSSDTIGRYGGEEFIILLPMTSARQALSLAERIRKNIARIRVPTPLGDAGVTISAGVVEMNPGAAAPETVDGMICRADQTMYAAKQAGRNCVKTAE